MRVLFGIILGVALTVSVAFISDTWSTGAASPQARAQPLSSIATWSIGMW